MAAAAAPKPPARLQPAARPTSATAKPAPAAPQGPDSGVPPKGSVGGLGDVNLYPKRVVIDPRQRVATVGLFNRTANPGDYDISIADMAMIADGRLVALDQVADPQVKARVRTASALLRWSPRRVTLNGHDAQTVRIMARITPDIAPGEYRSHFSAIADPADASGGFTIDQAAGAAKTGEIGVRIIPRFGISIPVIVRVGETTLTVGIRDPAVTAQPGGAKAVTFALTRVGTRSAFGNIQVTPASSKTVIAEVSGIGVYPEIDSRTVTVPFDAKADPRNYASGARLAVTFTDDDVSPGKVLARQEFTVP